jgi:uncharacterized repeat protein (TIGR01451 family)
MLAISKSDDLGFATIGDSVTYTIIASNAAGSTAVGAHVVDNLPPELVAATWTCSATAGGTCAASGTGSIDQLVTLPAGSSVTFVLTATLDAVAGDTLVNLATIDPPAGVTDPVLTDNTATDVDAVVIFRDGFEGDAPVILSTVKLDPANGGARTFDYDVRVEDRGVTQVVVSLRDGHGTEQARVLQVPIGRDGVQLIWLQRNVAGTWAVASSREWPMGTTVRIGWVATREQGGTVRAVGLEMKPVE